MYDLNSVKEDLKKRYLINVIITLVFILALFIYGAVGEFIIRNQIHEDQLSIPPDKLFLARVGCGLIILISGLAIHFVRSGILSGKINPDNRGIVRIPGSPADIFMRLTLSNIVTLAWCESIAIYSILGIYFRFTSADSLSLIVISFMMFAVFFPRYSKWEEYLESHLKQQNPQSQM